MVVAPLSGKIRLVYGLRVIPSFDEALGTVQKDYKIPIPDRRARWYANSVYRSYILDAAEKLQSQEGVSRIQEIGLRSPRSSSASRSEVPVNARSGLCENAGPQRPSGRTRLL